MRGLSLVAGLVALIGCGSSASGPAPQGNDATTSELPRRDADGGAVAARTDASTDASADAGTSVDASEIGADASSAAPAVRYIGRFDTRDPNGPSAGWPASRVSIRFEGTALSANLKQEDRGSGSNYLDIVVDGVAAAAPLEVAPGTRTLPIVAGLAAGIHVVDIVRRTEGIQGTLQYLGFSYPQGGKLLAPPPEPRRRIEFLGNSAVDGYGVEGDGPTCTGGGTPPKFTNARKSVGYIASAKLNADLVLLGQSGKGVGVNLGSGDTDTFPILFERTLPDDRTSRFFPSTVEPDAFVLIASNLDIDLKGVALANAYEAFIAKIRSAYPRTHLLLVVSSYSTDDYPVGAMTRTRLTAMTQSIAASRATAGDSKVYAYAMKPYVDGQLTGCDYHPGPALHAQMAGELEGWLKARLGW
jgi:hypothetical protein